MNVKDSNLAYGSQKQTQMADNSVIYCVISVRLGIYIYIGLKKILMQQ